MHIMEGFLPHPWWEIWWAIMIPIVAYGIYKLSKIAKKNPEAKPLLALMGAFIFVVSALKLPSVFGSSSHPTGSGLAAVVFGPAIASVLSMIALIFQATLLAHGGITTLGANVFSMGIVGPASRLRHMDCLQENSGANSGRRFSCSGIKRPIHIRYHFSAVGSGFSSNRLYGGVSQIRQHIRRNPNSLSYRRRHPCHLHL